MLGSRSSRGKGVEDTDLDLVPIMNMFLVMIPFLLLSASFFHLSAINTTVPVLSNSEGSGTSESTVRVTVIVQIEENGVHVSAMSDGLDERTLGGLDTFIPREDRARYPLDRLALFLMDIKTRYPRSDTVIIIPAESILYETIIKTMDVARSSDDTLMFPNVVISGKVG